MVYFDRFVSSIDQLLIDISPCRIYAQSLPQYLSVKRLVSGSVGKARLHDYAALEVALPLFGFGHDWACTFREAPLPSGASMSFRVHFSEASTLIRLWP